MSNPSTFRQAAHYLDLAVQAGIADAPVERVQAIFDTGILSAVLKTLDPWVVNRESLRRVLAGESFDAASAPLSATYPATGEVFELTLDGNAQENQPLEMVRRDGYGGEWTHKGPVVTGVHDRRFQLVQVGYCRRWDELLGRLRKLGVVPEGQWREAFKAKYPRPDGKGPVGVADASWMDPGGGADFPCVATDGRSDFGWTARDWRGRWRWLVEVGK